jgi:uncharacterized protein (TIGR02996 family)
VTTEDDFRRQLDARPEDWQTLLVFSDWLRERDDPRADGYAALARLRKCPLAQTFAPQSKAGWSGDWFAWMKEGLAVRVNRPGVAQPTDREALPPDWYDAVKELNQLPDWNSDAWSYFRTRFDALDAAATGFARLPAARQAELLATEPKVPTRSRKKW